MRKKIFIIISILLVCCACSEFLVQEPSTQVSVNEQFSTKEGIHQAVNGMYYNIEGFISGKYFLYADLQGGNLTFTPDKNDFILEIPASLGIEEVYQFRDRASDSEFEGFYNEAYQIINAANIIIERSKEAGFLSEQEKKQIRAEALTARAMIHYTLSLLYAQNYSFTVDASHPGVVYNTRTQIAGVDYPARETMKTTWELLQKDMEEALNLYTEEQALPFGPEYSYFNKITTSALYARMALQMNDWEKALNHAEFVINNSGISIMTKENYIPEWEKPEEPVSEIILEFTAPRESEGSVSSSVGYDYFEFADSENYNEIVASRDLIDLYDATDIRGEMFLMEELRTSVNEVITEEPYFFTKKFQDDPGTTYIRLSEMFLICAEANARLGNNAPALTDLNTIRERAGLAPITATENLLEEIFLERRRELAFEGHLFLDILRYQKDIIRKKGCLSNVCELPYPSDYFILPIPQTGVDLNENMEQNEGY